MTDALLPRDARAADRQALAELYRTAFPDEDLVPLVTELQRSAPDVVTLVAATPKACLGHAAFTPCTTANGSARVALLGPLAVHPQARRRGLARQLVEAGAARMAAAGAARLVVLGDPEFYRRLGFAREVEVQPPYDLPAAWAEAWQSRALSPDARLPAGRLLVPHPWLKPALWAP